MRCACAILCWIAAAVLASPVSFAGGEFDSVTVAPAKTSIYIGSVTLTSSVFRRESAGYVADYKATVFPYFFYNEKGRLRIDFNDDQLARLARGERVEFQGRAESSDGDPRKVEGHASPANASSGNLKVRIFVSPKIQLIFNTTYVFGQS